MQAAHACCYQAMQKQCFRWNEPLGYRAARFFRMIRHNANYIICSSAQLSNTRIPIHLRFATRNSAILSASNFGHNRSSGFSRKHVPVSICFMKSPPELWFPRIITNCLIYFGKYRECPKRRYYSPEFAVVRIDKVFNTACFTAKTPFYFGLGKFFNCASGHSRNTKPIDLVGKWW